MSQTTKEQIRELYADCSDEDLELIMTNKRTGSFNKTGEYLSDGEIHNNVHNEVMQDLIKDMVNKPKHYNQGGIETISYMKAYSTKEEFLGHLRLTSIKYLSRLMEKENPLQDAKKAKWYIEKLIEELS